jgi:poly-gamma-glutamate synthesis protein (capsule biosynthesis protein)
LTSLFRKCVLVLALSIPILLLTSCKGAAQPRSRGETQVATLAAVGDIFLSEAVLKDAKQVSGAYDFTPFLSGVADTLSGADITIGNFEGNFFGEPYDRNNAPDAFATALRTVGFDILQTANSYSIRKGLRGLEQTKTIIESAGISALGTYTSAADREDSLVHIREVNGIRIAFVAFTKGLDSMSLPDGAEHCVNLLYTDYTTDYLEINESGISAVLGAAKAQNPDIIVAALHWGSENISEVSETQEKIADLLFQNGADVILGTHSHRIGEVEVRQIASASGARKDVVLAYSLGDFCAADENDVASSLILNLEFTKDSATGITTISDVSYTPLAIADYGAGRAERFAVLDVNKEVALYEGNYFDRVSEELYEALLAIPEEITARTTPAKDEP